MYTSPCTAPAPHSAPVLTSTDPHEPTAKQQTTEPSHCQSKSLVCLPIICKPYCKASTKAYIHRNELACTCLQDVQAYPLTTFIASINVSFHAPCTAPVPHPTPMMSEPHPMAKQLPTGSSHHQRKCCYSSISIHL